MISSRKLYSDGEGAGSPVQNREGAVIEGQEQQDGAAAPDPDEAGGEELGWQSAGQLGAGLCLGREKAGASKVLINS
jgi:hypothetical protein